MAAVMEAEEDLEVMAMLDPSLVTAASHVLKMKLPRQNATSWAQEDSNATHQQA